jgi:hypothetical protein
MEPTPDTVNYMIAGHVVFAIVVIAYVASLVLRWSGLKREEAALKELDK